MTNIQDVITVYFMIVRTIDFSHIEAKITQFY